MSRFKKGEKHWNWKGGISTNKDAINKYQNAYGKEYHQKRRRLVLQFYGGNLPQCACCGERTYEFLALDHINGGGKKHRKELQKAGFGLSGYSLYSWIKKNDFPEGFQVLCHNCNQAKGYYGICPHKFTIKH